MRQEKEILVLVSSNRCRSSRISAEDLQKSSHNLFWSRENTIIIAPPTIVRRPTLDRWPRLWISSFSTGKIALTTRETARWFSLTNWNPTRASFLTVTNNRYSKMARLPRSPASSHKSGNKKDQIPKCCTPRQPSDHKTNTLHIKTSKTRIRWWCHLNNIIYNNKLYSNRANLQNKSTSKQVMSTNSKWVSPTFIHTISFTQLTTTRYHQTGTRAPCNTTKLQWWPIRPTNKSALRIKILARRWARDVTIMAWFQMRSICSTVLADQEPKYRT